MASNLKRHLTRQMFFPGALSLFINPFYFARKGLAYHMSDLARFVKGRTLDIGCGLKPYQTLCKSTEYIGLEIDLDENRVKKQADFYYDGNRFPFEDQSFDSAMANQVFEHVFNPNGFLTEVNRVLKPEGIFLISVPFVWDEHEQPQDFARYSSFGMRHLLQTNGFKVVAQRKSIADIRVIFQLFNGYTYKKTATSNTILNLIITVLLMAPINILGEIISKITPANSDLYLDNIILAKKA